MNNKFKKILILLGSLYFLLLIKKNILDARFCSSWSGWSDESTDCVCLGKKVEPEPEVLDYGYTVCKGIVLF